MASVCFTGVTLLLSPLFTVTLADFDMICSLDFDCIDGWVGLTGDGPEGDFVLLLFLSIPFGGTLLRCCAPADWLEAVVASVWDCLM